MGLGGMGIMGTMFIVGIMKKGVSGRGVGRGEVWFGMRVSRLG